VATAGALPLQGEPTKYFRGVGNQGRCPLATMQFAFQADKHKTTGLFLTFAFLAAWRYPISSSENQLTQSRKDDFALDDETIPP
jgi:hypothetical protein